jgi:hypothetical protein
VVALGAVWWWALIGEVFGPITQSGHHDFFAFYAAGTLVRKGRASDLYDASALTTLERGIWPYPTGYAGYMPFLNPPSAAALLSPFSLITFGAARILWFVLSVVIALACALLITMGRTPRVRVAGIVVTLASFPAYQTLVEGQWSFVLLLGALVALVAAWRGYPWLAGIALVTLWLKPPLLLFVLIWLLLSNRRRIAAGAIAGVVALTLVSLPWTGIGPDLAYVQFAAGVGVAHAAGGGAAGSTLWEGAFNNMEGLIGLAATIVGQSRPLAVDLLTAVMAIALIAYFVWATRPFWLRRPTPPVVVLAALSLGLLLDPHLYAQDCILVLVPVAVILRRIGSFGARAGLVIRGMRPETAEVALLIAAAVLMDLSAIDTFSIQGFAIPPLHLFTFALIAGVVVFGRAARRSEEPTPLRVGAG